MSWSNFLKEQSSQEYFINLKSIVERQRDSSIIYPPNGSVFNAFKLTNFDDVKVLLLGQDPYHGEGQANGLCFSVSNGIKLPPSLANIFREIESDLGVKCQHGNLEYWAKQGVFMLNSILTVRANSPASHQNIGWEIFTDNVIKEISDKKENIVFILWGRFAQSKKYLIDKNKHYILEAAHPSPFSAHNGFFNCRHFSKTNAILKSIGEKEIDWEIK